MAGPNSVPMRDKALAASLREFVCVTHKECEKDKDNCNIMTRRESLIRRNRLVTGKTR